MAAEKKTIRLLILEDSQNEAERMVNLFRNSGRATRVHRLTCSDDLAEAMQQTWDLLIAAPNSARLNPSEALTAIRRQTRDIPFIQLVDGVDLDAITAAIALGATSAIPKDQDELLVLVANRELANLEERRARRNAELALSDANKRCQMLLESSVDAIAYVHEGMHIHANRSYLELFRYEDAEALEGTPIIDLIASEDQAVFKDFLKNYQEQDSASELTCHGLAADGRKFDLRMNFSAAIYDSEPCIQIVIHDKRGNIDLEEQLRLIRSQDLVTGLFNRHHFLHQLDEVLEQAAQINQTASLAYLRVDRQATLLAEIGIAGMDRVLADLARLLRGHFPVPTTLARFADDAFTILLPGQKPEQIRGLMNELLKAVETHLFEVDGRTIQTTLSIGVVALDQKTTRSQEIIDRAHRCAEELEAGNGLNIFDQASERVAAASQGNALAMVQLAMENDQFRLLFQPIISLRGGAAEHYEVLLRLLDPTGKEVSPDAFFDAASTERLAEKIDRWVILNSIKRLSEHRSKGHNTRLFINLSAASLQDPKLVPWLSAALEGARLPSDTLIFQFNEKDATHYLKQTKILAQGLTQLHCKVSISQFGCTINPFNTLKHLSVDFVKIDSSYMQDLRKPENQEALKGLLAKLHAQARPTIVPFVETASTMTTLWQSGVNYIQGYFVQGPSQTMNYEFSSGNE